MIGEKSVLADHDKRRTLYPVPKRPNAAGNILKEVFSMKKIVALLLVLAMLLAMGSMALAADKVTYYVRGGTAEYEPYIYPGLVGLLKIQEMADVEIDWTVVCGNGDEIHAQYLSMLSSG